MANVLRMIGDNISLWWQFLFANNVPGTSFSFGALYLFVVFFSIFIGVLSLILGKGDDKK